VMVPREVSRMQGQSEISYRTECRTNFAAGVSWLNNVAYNFVGPNHSNPWHGRNMATSRPSSEDLRRIQELARGWGKIIVTRHWGEKGPGPDVTLAQMEEVAMAAVQSLLAGTLEDATRRQATEHLGSEQPCPECGRVCSLTHEQREVVARIGSLFSHDEPKGHCPACRRDFFPSASNSETGDARLHAERAAQDRDGGGRGEVAHGRCRGAQGRR
jgi:hypothetical protein